MVKILRVVHWLEVECFQRFPLAKRGDFPLYTPSMWCPGWHSSICLQGRYPMWASNLYRFRRPLKAVIARNKHEFLTSSRSLQLFGRLSSNTPLVFFPSSI